MVPNPSLKKAARAWKEAEAEQSFWTEHYDEFLQQYGEQFVAVYKGAVVATSPDLQQLIHMLEGKALGLQQVWVRFITVDPRRIAL